MIDSTTLEQNALVVIGKADLVLQEHPAFTEARSTVLAMLSGVGTIENPDDLKDAVEASASAAFLISGAEKCRKKQKEPYWNAGKAIDTFYDGMTTKLVAAKAQADRQISTFKMEEHRRIQEAERKQREEADRISREAQIEAQKAREAPTIEAREQHHEQAQVLREEAKAVVQAPLAVAPVEVEGLRAKPEKTWRITDPAAVYKVRPDFFDLTERKRAIKSALDAGFQGCAGIVIEEGINVRTR